MPEKSLLEQYAEELMKNTERISRRKEGKKPQGPCGFFKKERSEQDIMLEKAKVDSLFDSFRGVQRLNRSCTHEYQADIVYRNHWRASIPDEVWEHMLKTVARAQECNENEDELWRNYYENRLTICGPGDSNVYVYYTPRGRKARYRCANGSRWEAIRGNSDGNDALDRERVYTCGGRRYYIVGGCYREVPEGEATAENSS